MRVTMLSREFPPEVYGGAGVHVEHLVPHLADHIEVDVHCFGAPRPDATAHPVPAELREQNFALQTLGVDLAMAAAAAGSDLVHSHTWYANMGGHWASLLHGIPHVVTAHSLEPRRPWKAEQLGGGYRLSSWAERTAYEGAAGVIAVSDGMRADVLDAYPFLDPDRVHVVRNGIDTDAFAPDTETDALVDHGIDPARPSVLFVGRITRQKGVPHLLAAVRDLPAEAQVVLCAGSPDTPELGREVAIAIEELQRTRDGVVWIPEMLPRRDLVQFLTHATVFACPSVYEPLGIVNLEAMACETAVVASDVGGIPEVVVDGETGLLVHYDEADPAGFEAGLTEAITRVLADPAAADRMGAAGRQRAVAEFGWDAVARRTIAVYEAALAG